jgi:hypothetical protein
VRSILRGRGYEDKMKVIHEKSVKKSPEYVPLTLSFSLKKIAVIYY